MDYRHGKYDLTFTVLQGNIHTTKVLPIGGGIAVYGEYFLTTFYPTVPIGAHGNSGVFVVKENNQSLYFAAKSTKNSQKAPDIVFLFAFGTQRPQVQVLSPRPEKVYIPLLRCVDFSFYIGQDLKRAVCKANCDLPVDGCKARVRAGETFSPGKSCHLDQKNPRLLTGIFQLNPSFRTGEILTLFG